MSNLADIQNLEAEIDQAKELIVRREAAIKLSKNPEFRMLFLKEYFESEAARLVQLSADPALDAQQRADALNMAQATGHTKRYLSMAYQMGAVAEREIHDKEAELEHLRTLSDDDSVGDEE